MHVLQLEAATAAAVIQINLNPMAPTQLFTLCNTGSCDCTLLCAHLQFAVDTYANEMEVLLKSSKEEVVQALRRGSSCFAR